jgi:hypothetical protein
MSKPKCPHCGAELFDCKTDSRGICVKAPTPKKKEGQHAQD